MSAPPTPPPTTGTTSTPPRTESAKKATNASPEHEVFYQPLLSDQSLAQLIRGQALVARGQELIATALASMKAIPVATPASDLAVFDTKAPLQASEALVTAVEEGVTKKRRRVVKEKAKRLSPYIVFFQDMNKSDRSRFENYHEFMQHCAERWKSLGEVERKVYHERAEELNKHYREEFDAAHPSVVVAEPEVATEQSLKLSHVVEETVEPMEETIEEATEETTEESMEVVQAQPTQQVLPNHTTVSEAESEKQKKKKKKNKEGKEGKEKKHKHKKHREEEQ